MKVFSGTSCIELSENICSKLREKNNDIKLGDLKIDRFSDGEILPNFLESVRGEDIFFIQSLYNSDIIIETLLVIDAAKRAGCKSFNLVAPYMAMSRQDKKDHNRSSFGAKMVANILESSGIDQLITIELHNPAICGFYNIPVINLNGNKIFIDYILEKNIEDLCILAPDAGAQKRASNFGKKIQNSTFAMINKKRTKPNIIDSVELLGEVKDKNVLIIDDMLDTCGTVCSVTEVLIDNGAKSVTAIAPHGILSGKAISNINNSSLNNILVSDSIPNRYVKNDKIVYVSCDKLLADVIHALTHKESISKINEI